MSEQIRVLRATLNVPHETAFFKPDAMNSLPTYPVPPITTIQGMLYAAMGRPSLLQPNQLPNDVRSQEEDFRQRVRDECRFGERVVDRSGNITSLRSRQKAASGKTEEAYVTYPTQAETLIQPTYRIYVTGPDDLLSAFEYALENPQRMLYLGRSDDMVDIEEVDVTSATHIEEEATVNCVVPGADRDPVLLPVSPDYRGRYGAGHPGQVKTVSIGGGDVDEYYQTDDDEQFVFVTE